MPSKYPVLHPDDLIRAIRKKGYNYVSQKGSHRKYTDGKHVIIIPMHDEIARGTLRSILAMMDLTVDQLMQLLE